jgi:osmoprotectant transport system permease protein
VGWVTAHSAELIRLTLEHIVLSCVSLGIALVVAVPLGVWAHGRSQRIALLTSATGLVYTVPSLALFAILVPIVGLGTTPLVVGLVAYAQLMLIRATIAGLDSVPTDVRDAALGIGLDRLTLLTKVDAPLGMPVFLAGVRIAAVTVIGIATIGAVVDAGGLGELIFQGIQRSDPRRVLAGALLVTTLAIAADFALVRVERRVKSWAVSPT